MSLTKEEYWDKVNFIINNSIFIRSGSCLQCGKCCYAYDENYMDGTVKRACHNLSGTICLVHNQKAEVCQIALLNPIYPTQCMVPEANDTCGYSWVVNDKLTKVEALEKFNRLCDICNRKDSCDFYDEVIKEINEVCQ